MGRLIDLTNKTFGRLVAIKRWGSDKHNKPTWLCRCECGKETIVSGQNLRRGNTKSCGCLSLEINKKQLVKHGLYKSKEYKIWTSMLQRCTNPNASGYEFYGARGISVDPKWLDFQNFYADMGKRPSSKHSIERIDNSANYEPCNCKWETANKQAINKRTRQDNKTGHKGIDWYGSRQKWRTRITFNKKTLVLGYFDRIEDAIEARKKAEQKYHKKLS